MRDILITLSERDTAKVGHTDRMISLTTDAACVYMCLCMSTLTLIASIMALYILIAQTKVTERRNIKEEKDQEGRQAKESTRPRCLPQL